VEPSSAEPQQQFQLMGSAKIPIVGIVGGIASGKSLVAAQLERQGAVVVDADKVAHDVLKLDEVKALARERWGEAIFDNDGQIDRQALGKFVFAGGADGPRELKYLESLTHPRIGKLVLERIAHLSEAGTATAIVLDVPLLFESGWNKICDKTIFVDAERGLRENRAVLRGWTPEEFARREAAQESLEKKRKLADVVIDNSGTPQATHHQLDLVWQSWFPRSSFDQSSFDRATLDGATPQ
jgi:dephospho-CoA kinase